MKKKILSIILIGMMSSVALWGCGGAPAVEETDAATEEVSEETEEEPVEETEEEPPQNMVTIYLPVRCFYGEPDGTEFAGKTEYEYDDHGNLIKSTDYFWDENTVDGMTEVEYEYDDEGRIAKEVSYRTPFDYEGNVEGDRIKNSEEEYEYNDDGTLLKSTKTEWFELNEFMLEMDPELVLQQRVTELKYDEYANAVKENIFDSYLDGSEYSFEFTYEHEYGENGTIVKSVESRMDSNVKVVREYDEYGNQTDAYQTVPDDSGLTPTWEKCEYTYDEQGRVIEVLSYTHEILNEGKYTTKYEYDANGNIIKILSDGGSITTYEYMEMQIPDIKHYHKDNNLIIFGLRYISV